MKVSLSRQQKELGPQRLKRYLFFELARSIRCSNDTYNAGPESSNESNESSSDIEDGLGSDSTDAAVKKKVLVTGHAKKSEKSLTELLAQC